MNIQESLVNFAIIGCGRIGKKRAASLPPRSLLVACDSDISRAKELAASSLDVVATSDVSETLASAAHAVVVATPNALLAPTALRALRAGKAVLVEKPGAVSTRELADLKALSLETGLPVRVGYNHRYHSAVMKARQLIEAGAIGRLMFVRARYGHGGRPGYNQEWRANPRLSGGGELIDQGVHLVDLAGWFLGEFSWVDGHTVNFFWDMAVEDNAFLKLQTNAGQIAWLHASCTEWKNLFSFEIYGRTGKLQIDGLGGSYGVERLTFYKMLPEMGPPETTIWKYPGIDVSWDLEMQDFLEDIRLGRTPVPGLKEAQAALAVVEQVYKDNTRSTS